MAVSVDLAPTLGGLLARRDLNLHLTSQDLASGVIDREIRWVHSSDLADPTPFLADDVVLLTTGTQLTDDAAITAYVRRLASRGVIALGFGTEVVRAGVPASLVAACAEAGMPLFEVPYRTPFIALARANAEAVAAQAYARRTWALDAQRAISLAALRPDGLGATLTELAKQLGTWVGMYDAAGVLTREFPADRLDSTTAAALGDEVGSVLRRGARAASSLTIASHPFTLQTLGRGGHLRGVIAIEANDLDQEGRGVLTSVIAMAGLALEQQTGLSRARSSMRTGVIDILRAGNLGLARRVARSLGDALPPAPTLIGIAAAPPRAEPLVEWLELAAIENPGSVLFGRLDDAMVVVTSADNADVFASLAERFNVHVGVSTASAYDEFAVAYREALFALEHPHDRVTTFVEAQSAGVLASLAPHARAVASRALAPLVAHDDEHGTALIETLRTFLQHDGSNEQTASALSVHRHTVRARIQLAERVLGRSLSSFPARADLWAAFVATA